MTCELLVEEEEEEGGVCDRDDSDCGGREEEEEEEEEEEGEEEGKGEGGRGEVERSRDLLPAAGVLRRSDSTMCSSANTPMSALASRCNNNNNNTKINTGT